MDVPGQGLSVSGQEESAQQVTEKIDVYSFGVLLWEIWTWGAPSCVSCNILFPLRVVSMAGGVQTSRVLEVF